MKSALLPSLPALCAAAAAISVYPDLSRPAQHPRFGTTATTPSTWADFGNLTRFATLRGFSQTANGTIVNYKELLAQYEPLGDVIWPVYLTAFAPNYAEVLAYMAAQGLYVTDLWGYVPGSGPGAEMWSAFTAPPGFLADASALLGNRWLGFDVGEQDGRYIGSYAEQHAPLGAPPAMQRQFFEDHFQAMYSQLGGRVVALQSLTFAHAMAQSGVFTIIGCESAQALVSAQLFYAVARGAGKTYGVLWFGNISVYNRFGYKTYPSSSAQTRTDAFAEAPASPRRATRAGNSAASRVLAAAGRTYACADQGEGGPECGTSLSLMAKLMYAQILYNSGYVSFESSWFNGTALSPVGLLQAAARTWLADHGSPGAHLATVALLLDHAAGFTAPRHLYSGSLFRAWGNLPYAVARGDFLADGLLRVVYPGYADSSYFHDETGFSAPTPAGDALDVLLSDAPDWLLARYDTLLLAGSPRTEPGLLRRKLEAALAAGARLLAWAGALGAWTPAGGVAGCGVAEAAYSGAWPARCAAFPAGTAVTVLLPSGGSVNVSEPAAFQSCVVECGAPAGAAVPVAWAWTASGAQVPIAWRAAPLNASAGGGALLLFGSPYGVAAAPAGPAVDPGVDAPLGSPFPLLAHVAALAGAELADRAPFSLPGLTHTAARGTAGPNADGTVNYTIVVSNPTLAQLPLDVAAACNVGAVAAVTELPAVPLAVRAAPGYLPDGFAGADLGNSTAAAIAGADTRAFRLAVHEDAARLRVLPAAPPPPRRPRRLALNVRGLEGLPVRSLRALAAGYPSLPTLFDTLVVDWGYLAARETAALAAEAAFLRQTGIAGVVEFDSGCNLFPGLRLFNNSAPEYGRALASISDVLGKAAAMGWRHAVLALHRTPENNMAEADAIAGSAQTLAALAALAAPLNVTLHLRNGAKSPVGGLAATGAWLAASGLAGSIRLQPSLAAMVAAFEPVAHLQPALAAGPGALAIVSAACPRADAAGDYFADTAPLTVAASADGGGGCADADRGRVAALVALACGGGGADSACLGGPAAPAPAAPAVLLVVDAYTGAEALLGEAAGGGDAAGPGAGAALDLAYEEARWLLGAAVV